MRKSRSAVVLQRTEHRIGIDLVSGPCQITAAIITTHIITVRGNGASVVRDVRARRTGVQDRISNLKRPVDTNAAAIVAADRAVQYSAAPLDTATGEGSIVVAKSAVIKRQDA